MQLSRSIGWILLPLLLVSAGAAAWLAGLGGGGLESVRELIASRQYEQAVAAIEARLEANPAVEQQEKLRFLLGHARLMMKDLDGARAAFQRFIEAHPDSPLRHKAVWKRADADLAEGRYEAALGTYRAEVLRLISPERKGEISDIYRRFAEEYLKKDPRDWKAARAFYDLAADLGLTAQQRQELLRSAAAAATELKDHADAARRYAALRKEYGDGPAGAHLFGLAEARLAQGQHAAARRTYEDYLRRFAEGQRVPEALLGLAHTYGLPRPADRDRLERGATWLRRFLAEHGAHARAAEASFEIAESYFALKLFDDAVVAYEEFLRRFEEGHPDLAGRARVAIGEGRLLQGRFDDAIAAWKVFLGAHPFHELWAGVQKKIVDAEYRKAIQAVADEERERARGLIREFLERHPLENRNPVLMYTLGQLSFDEEKFSQATLAWERLATKYPKSNAASRGLYMIGRVHETKTHDFEKAIAAYKRCTFGSHKKPAAARLAALEKKSLSVRSEGVFRAAEAAEVSVRSRNIEKLRVRVYPLQLESYFRARAGRGIEDLDVEVIEAAHTAESKLADFQKYRETEREVALGVTGPGAWVVKMDDGELKATTLVLRSDLALLVKATRHDLIALVQDRVSGNAVAGARVVVSDGERVIFEGESGTDGVFHHRDEKLKAVERIFVLAAHEGQLATSGLSLNGLGHRAGLVAHTHVGFDRPAYRPGEEVQARAIVRDVSQGRYTFTPGQRFTLALLDPAGIALLERAAELSDHGTLAAAFALPDSAALGSYQIVVRDGEDAVRGRGGFEVQRYKLERFRLALEPEAAVVYRGETLRGKVRASFFHGAPAADRAVRVELRGVGVQEGRTDAEGRYAFEFETEDLGGEQLLQLMAWLSEDNVGTATAVMVSSIGLQLGIETVREVVLAGESLDARLTSRDMLGKAAAAEGVLRLFELRRERGTVTEVEAGKHEVMLPADDEGRVQRVAFPAGGWYRLRLEARDRFDNLITAQKDIFSSNADDEVKLRIFADRDRLRAGTTERLRMHSRLDEVLALITHEGDGFLGYEVRRLLRGESVHELSVSADLAPNFALAVAAWSGRKLYEARHEFRVERDLRVELEPAAAELRPGEEARVRVRVRDAAGQPVAAEVAVAAVDEALLELYPGRAAGFASAFEGGVRETAARASASCTFNYAAQTRPVVKALAERDRSDRGLARDSSRGRNRAGEPRPRARGFWTDAPELAQVDELSNANLEWSTSLGIVAERPAQQLGQQVQTGVFFARGQNLDRRARAEQYFGQPMQQGVELHEVLNNLSATQMAWQQDMSGQLSALGYLNSGAYYFGGENRLRPEVATRIDFRATAYWNPALIVPPEGAEVRFQLPDSTTAWKLTGRGVTRATAVGEGSAKLVTRLPLEAWLKLPEALLEGDEVVIAGIVRNQSGGALPLTARISVDGALSAAAEDVERTLEDGAELAFELRVRASDAGMGTVRLQVSSERYSDVVERDVPVRPWSTVLFEGVAGSARDSTQVTLDLPAGKEFSRQRMSVEILPPFDEELLALATRGGDANFARAQCALIVDTLGRTITRGLTALELEGWYRDRGAMSPGRARQLRTLLEAAVARVVQAQNGDGGFDWVGLRANQRERKVASDPLTSARALELLVRSRAAGIEVAEAVVKKATDYVGERYRKAPLERADLKARLVNALCWAGEAEYSYLNRLARSKASLGDVSLGLLAEAFLVVGRRGELADLVDELAGRAQRDSRGAHWAGNPAKGAGDAVEATGLALKALVVVKPGDPLVRAAARWLRGRAAGYGSAAGTAAAVKALVAVGSEGRAEQRDFELQVAVNGRAIGSFKSVSSSGSAAFDVPAKLIRERNAISFTYRGNGEYRWRVRFEGTVPGVVDEENREVFTVRRRVRPAPLRYAKRAIGSGFSTVERPEETWEHEAKHLAPGESASVQLYFMKPRRDTRRLEYLVLEESVPAGATVAPGSVAGNFSHYVQGGGTIVFFFPAGIDSGNASFELLGYLPGENRMLPARVWPYHHPELMSWSKPGALGILRAGEENPDQRRLTPDELYHLGKARHEAGEHAAALADLERFLGGWRPLEKFHQEAARMAFYSALKLSDSARVVRYFELLKERHPDLVVAFEKMIEVGDAYAAMEEHERAWQVYRAVAEASFLKDLGVAGTLDEQKEFLGSVDFVRRLVREYPDLPVVASTAANLGQLVYGRSGGKVLDREGKTIERRDLLRFSAELGEDFIVEYPENVLCDEVAFGISNVRLEREEYELAIAAARAGGTRYTSSSLLDDYLYIQGYADFALGRYEPALDTLRRVSSGEDFSDGKGGRGPGDHRDLATYMIGQIHHARGEVPRAIESYEEVSEKFLDAKEAIESFRRRELALPEVADFAPGDKVEVDLHSRNLESAQLHVYRVDLMRLYLIERNLDRVTGIELSGIAPYLEREVVLGSAEDYAERTTRVALPLEEAGAYLLVARSGELSAAGMVLKTDLALEITEDVASGRVRVNVSARAGGPLPRAEVQVIGSGSPEFEGGRTDLRGVFVAEDVVGRTTVMVREGGRVAYHRGKQDLQPQRMAQQRQVEREQRKSFKEAATEDLYKFNRAMNLEGQQQLEKLLRNKQAGVEVRRAKK